MKTRSLRWLEKKMKIMHTFDGSLLKHVGSSGGMGKIAAKLEVDPSRVLKLDANENFFVSSHRLNVMLREVVKNLDLRFYNFDGVVELREALGKYVGASPKCIAIGSGSDQLIDLIVHLFLEKGDNVVSIVPSFFMYQKRVLLKEAKFFGAPLNRDLSLNKEAILDKVTSRTRLLFICSPNNPTGNQFEWEKIEALIDECPAIVVIDEAYAEFADYSAASLAVKKRNVIVLRTFSKAFGLAGMRFGYAVGHSDIASLLSETVPYTVGTVTSKCVLKLLGNMRFIEKSIEMVKVERKRLISELRAIEGIEIFDSKANFVTFKPYKDAERVYHRLLEKGIMIKNLGNLPVIGHCLRVTVGLPYMNDQFLNALKQILE